MTYEHREQSDGMQIPKSLINELYYWFRNRGYGNLTINFSGGKIMNMKRIENVKVDPIGYIVPTQSFCNVSVTANAPKGAKLE